MGGSGLGLQAYVEEFNEDTNTPLPDTRQTANIAAKRSRPDLGKLKTSTPGRDEASDSGVSSHAGATVGSGNTSVLSSKISSPKPLKSDAAAKTTMPSTTEKEREKEKGKKQETRSGSPTKKSSLRKSISHQKKQENLRADKPCDCRECAAKMQLSGSPVHPKTALSHQAPTQKATAPPSRPHTAKPPSPTKTSRTSQPQDIPITQYSQQRPQTAHLYPSRPVSFHGGMSYPATAYPVYPQPPVFIPTGPPLPLPSFPPPPQPQPMSYGPPLQTAPPRNSAYPYAQSPSYNPRAPVMAPQLISDPYQNRRRSSFYDGSPHDYNLLQPPQPPISYPTVPVQSAYVVPQGRRTSIHYDQRPSPVSPPEDYFSLEEYYRRAEDRRAEDARLMPPPAPIPRKAHIVQPTRPPISRAATTSMAHSPFRPSPTEHGFVDNYERQDRRVHIQDSRPSARPSILKRITSGRSKKHKETEVIDRRSSSTVRAPEPPSRTRDRPKSYHAPIDPREDDAEKYQAEQAAKRDVVTEPLAAVEVKQDIREREHAHGAASRASRTSRKSGSSDEKHGKGGSSRVSTERHRRTSELKSRRGEDEEFNENGFTIRMEKEGAITLNFNGTSTDDRTIKWKPSRDDTGGVELSIVGNSGREGGRDMSSTRYSVVGSSRSSRVYRDVELSEELKKLHLGEKELTRVNERNEKDEKGERVVRDGKEVRRPVDPPKPLENDRVRRIQTTTTRGRRSSRSVVGRAPMEEGRPF